MLERWKRPHYKFYNLQRGKEPLFVRAMYVRKPEIRRQVRALQDQGVVVNFQKMVKTPYQVRETLHPEDKGHVILTEALQTQERMH